MKKTIILSVAAVVLAACCNQPKFDGPAYLDPDAPVEVRVEDPCLVGQTKKVNFVIDAEDFSYFDADKHEWVAESGEFKALIASSSKNIRAEIPFILK